MDLFQGHYFTLKVWQYGIQTFSCQGEESLYTRIVIVRTDSKKVTVKIVHSNFHRRD